MKYDTITNIYSLCVFGHRSMTFTEQDEINLYNLFEDFVVNKRVGVFNFGGFGDFDDFAHKVATKLKEKYPFIKTVLCLWDGKYPWWAKKRKYDKIEELPLEFDYWYTRLYYRNTAMIDASDLIIFYVTNTENSGAYKAMRHAVLKKRPFINFGVIKQ